MRLSEKSSFQREVNEPLCERIGVNCGKGREPTPFPLVHIICTRVCLRLRPNRAS